MILKSKTSLFILLLLFTSNIVLAQTDAQKAKIRVHITNANSALQSSNWDQALNNVNKAQDVLGSSAAIFESIKIKAYHGKKEYQKAKEHLLIFFQLNPSDNLIDEIAPISADIDDKIEEERNRKIQEKQRKLEEIEKERQRIIEEKRKEEELYNRAKANKSIFLLQSYLDKYPTGKYRVEVLSLLEKQKDIDAWQNAERINTPSAINKYLNNYRNGKYRDKAESALRVLHDKAYNNAIAQGTQKELNYYLSNFPNGRYKSEIDDLLENRKEEDAFEATKSGDLSDFENYLKKYPDGKYASGIKNAIQVFKYNEAETLLKDKLYWSAIQAYEAYISRFPYATNINKAKKKLRKAERKSNKYSSGYIGFSYESQEAFGITGGKLNQSQFGFYWNLRMTRALDVQFTEPEAEISLNNLPDDSELGLITLSIGWSYPVLYPVWLYVGGGVSYQERFTEQEYEYFYFRLEDEDQFAFYPETGINIRLSRSFVLIGGAAFVRDETLYKVGIGLNF